MIRQRFRPSPMNLKSKILFSTLGVVLLVSVCIALVARYILISSLTRELEFRGLGIAQSIADRSAPFILTQDEPALVNLAFEAVLVGERQDLITYIYILDTEHKVLASTFIVPFPEFLRDANPLKPGDKQSIQPLDNVLGGSVYDVAVPVKEGIYDVGSVHVGLSQQHIGAIVTKLRNIFVGFIAGIILFIFFLSQALARSITKPIHALMRVAEDIRRDNLEFSIDFDGRADDEVVQLADSFANMVRHIKEYRAELKRSQLKYRSLFHSGPDPIFVLDMGGLTVLDANPMATEVFGYSRMELVNKPIVELAPDVVSQLAQAFPSSDMDAQARCVSFPKSLAYRSSNEPFYVNLHVCSTIYEEQPALIVSATDITDMIEKDAQLIQASKMKSLGEMSAGIAHEVNQPLNAIKVGSEYLELLASKGETIPPETFAKVTRQISQQVDRASEIIQAMRQFGRKAELLRERMDLAAPVRNVLRILRQQLQLDSVKLDVHLPEDVPYIMGQENRLQQVIFNLVTNARDAVCSEEAQLPPSKRRIEVAVYQNDGIVCLRVADNGVGIPASRLDKIFEPFYTTKETGKGMGLGLAITYGIVKDCNGEITVESEPGKGTAFILSFPALEEPQ
ncbi:ATP-binding protein [Oceanidesulfovibrio marinus]|nr:ATP-binding protein [Oceanidesulfovibrio marinus]